MKRRLVERVRRKNMQKENEEKKGTVEEIR